MLEGLGVGVEDALAAGLDGGTAVGLGVPEHETSPTRTMPISVRFTHARLCQSAGLDGRTDDEAHRRSVRPGLVHPRHVDGFAGLVDVQG